VGFKIEIYHFTSLKQDLRAKNMHQQALKKQEKLTIIFGRFHKLFYFSKTNIKTFLKHLVNSNSQLKGGLSKQKTTFSCINQDTSLIRCITKTSLKHY
jgi:hypothetical protein